MDTNGLLEKSRDVLSEKNEQFKLAQDEYKRAQRLKDEVQDAVQKQFGLKAGGKHRTEKDWLREVVEPLNKKLDQLKQSNIESTK